MERMTGLTIKTLLFDLDGTLLPMDQDEFIAHYFAALTKKMAQFGYDPRELTDAVWRATEKMILDQGPHTNERVFWDEIEKIYGPRVRLDIPEFEAFYHNEFQDIAAICPSNPESRKLIDDLKQDYRIILATNPIFPAAATESRIRWAGLSPDDFELVTTYENSHAAKPSKAYFEEILEKMNLNPDECLMIGNDAREDLGALKAGIPVFLVTDHLLHGDHADLSEVPHGSFEDLRDYLKQNRG